MRSLMLVLGACLVAFSLSGCCNTGGGCLLRGGLFGGGNAGCSGGCGDSACSGGSDQNNFSEINYGGSSGLGLGLMEAGPSCQAAGCNGGCQSCQQGQQAMFPRLGSRLASRPPIGSRLKGRLGNRQCGCGGGMDCGCGAASPAPSMPMDGCGCGAPAGTDCGCSGSAPGNYSMGDAVGGDCGCDASGNMGGEIQQVSYEDRRGLLGKLFGGQNKLRGGQGGVLGGGHGGLLGGGNGGALGGGAIGCGVGGCGGPAGLCGNCRARLAGKFGAGASSIPHRDPTIHSGGGAAGPAGQIPTYAYPYYTTRAPRDFLDPKPPTIGY